MADENDSEEVWKDEDFLSLATTTSSRHNEEAENDVSSSIWINRSDLPPWMNDYTDFRRVSPLVALHNEIVGFSEDLMCPMPEEMKARDALVDNFKKLANKTFGDKCDVLVFGSQATGLCLPSSDIDIVIHLPNEAPKEESGVTKAEKDGNELGDDQQWKQMRDKTPLEQLAEALRENWYDKITYLEVIANTKVPLVKFECDGVAMDVSFLKETGPQAATLMKTFMQAMPPLRPLTFVLKYFLAARVLNEPYSGGVGSYLLQLMIVSFLQHRERESVNYGKSGVYNLGCLLLEFLELYGTKFNYCTTGISVRHDGSYFRKGERQEVFVNPARLFSLAVENPLDISTDVGKASFRIQMVQRAFGAAYKVLLAHTASPVEPVVSILATIIPPTSEMAERKRLKATSTMLSKPLGNPRPPPSTSPQRKKRRFR